MFLLLHHNKRNLAIVITITITLLFCTTRAQNNTNCQNRCGDEIVQYPFGFSEGCEIKLRCINNQVQVGGFLVQNLTKSSIFIYLPAKCNRSMQSIQPLFDKNFAPTKNNSFLVQDCSVSLGGCVIPASSFVGNQIEFESCDSKSGNISCFTQQQQQKDNEVIDFVTYEELNKTGCNNLFSSIAVDVEEKKEISLQFQAIELGWWLQGSCDCSSNATCTDVNLQGGSHGFRCQCLDGFIGDGFANGTGCRRGQFGISDFYYFLCDLFYCYIL